ncbi:MAG: hypothetical protein NT099_02055 [Candidatus Saganbacteria bacterium]|nr:hypothetical protein [Candidatus Saganbacteria bacterium]
MDIVKLEFRTFVPNNELFNRALHGKLKTAIRKSGGEIDVLVHPLFTVAYGGAKKVGDEILGGARLCDTHYQSYQEKMIRYLMSRPHIPLFVFVQSGYRIEVEKWLGNLTLQQKIVLIDTEYKGPTPHDSIFNLPNPSGLSEWSDSSPEKESFKQKKWDHFGQVLLSLGVSRISCFGELFYLSYFWGDPTMGCVPGVNTELSKRGYTTQMLREVSFPVVDGGPATSDSFSILVKK